MFNDFKAYPLKSYRGFGIDKCRWIDSDGNIIKKYPPFYLVSDEDDYIGEEYDSVEEAKTAIDDWFD